MADNYTPPEASLEMASENNSGQGKVDDLPEGIKGFSWGAFLLSWIWAIGNSTWIGLLALVPYVGLLCRFIWVLKAEKWHGKINVGIALSIFNEYKNNGHFGAC